MQITIISGSHSVDSQSARVADYLRRRLLDLPLGCYLPEHLVIRDVRQQLPIEGDIAQPLGERIDYCLQLLVAYADGLSHVRSRLPERSAAFAFGM